MWQMLSAFVSADNRIKLMDSEQAEATHTCELRQASASGRKNQSDFPWSRDESGDDQIKSKYVKQIQFRQKDIESF